MMNFFQNWSEFWGPLNALGPFATTMLICALVGAATIGAVVSAVVYSQTSVDFQLDWPVKTRIASTGITVFGWGLVYLNTASGLGLSTQQNLKADRFPMLSIFRHTFVLFTPSIFRPRPRAGSTNNV